MAIFVLIIFKITMAAMGVHNFTDILNMMKLNVSVMIT
jgi:hypothetical protein